METETAVLPAPRSTAGSLAPISAAGHHRQPQTPRLISTATTAGGSCWPSTVAVVAAVRRVAVPELPVFVAPPALDGRVVLRWVACHAPPQVQLSHPHAAPTRCLPSTSNYSSVWASFLSHTVILSDSHLSSFTSTDPTPPLPQPELETGLRSTPCTARTSEINMVSAVSGAH